MPSTHLQPRLTTAHLLSVLIFKPYNWEWEPSCYCLASLILAERSPPIIIPPWKEQRMQWQEHLPLSVICRQWRAVAAPMKSKQCPAILTCVCAALSVIFYPPPTHPHPSTHVSLSARQPRRKTISAATSGVFWENRGMEAVGNLLRLCSLHIIFVIIWTTQRAPWLQLLLL